MKTPVRRLILTTLLLIAMSLALSALSRQESVPLRASFDAFPRQIGEWTGSRAPDFDQRVMAVLGVDDYVNWTMRRHETLLGLYIGYWGTQRHGDTVHSPLNCLPGSGWQPTERGTIDLRVSAGGGVRTITVNRIIIERGLDRQLVLYWYQSGARVVASEYAGKVYTVLDAIRYNRSDAAMVRVVIPLGSLATDAAAERAATEFVGDLFGVLPRFLPV